MHRANTALLGLPGNPVRPGQEEHPHFTEEKPEAPERKSILPKVTRQMQGQERRSEA